MTLLRLIRNALPALLLFLPLTCVAQKKWGAAPVQEPAYVTIYSRPLSLNSFTPGSKNGFYSGRIYEGDHQLAHLGPSHFVTFAIPAGSHTFAANHMTSSSSSGGGTITLDLQPGRRYFLLASMKIPVNPMETGFFLKEIPCAEAKSTNQKSKSLTGKDLFPEGEKLIVADNTFPSCPGADPDRETNKDPEKPNTHWSSR